MICAEPCFTSLLVALLSRFSILRFLLGETVKAPGVDQGCVVLWLCVAGRGGCSTSWGMGCIWCWLCSRLWSTSPRYNCSRHVEWEQLSWHRENCQLLGISAAALSRKINLDSAKYFKVREWHTGLSRGRLWRLVGDQEQGEAFCSRAGRALRSFACKNSFACACALQGGQVTEMLKRLA